MNSPPLAAVQHNLLAPISCAADVGRPRRVNIAGAGSIEPSGMMMIMINVLVGAIELKASPWPRRF